jgi:hypothetical protein
VPANRFDVTGIGDDDGDALQRVEQRGHT